VLRRKLLIILGTSVVLMLAAAVCAVVMLQNVLQDLSHIRNVGMQGTGLACRLGITISAVEVELTALRRGDHGHLDTLIDRVDELESQIASLSKFYVVQTDASGTYSRVAELLPVFKRHVGALATTPDPELSLVHTEEALFASLAMREEIVSISRVLQEHLQEEQSAVMTKFRTILLGLIVVFLVVINVTILMLMRAASIVLSPVDQLVDASRRLAQEDFAHRIQLSRHDEFDELAGAFNDLAAQLQSNEERKIETLQHVARTLNHELNNAISIIELQLKQLERSAGTDQSMAKPLQQIHNTLERMALTIGALKRIRRIVLTDYLEGVKMLDLERSVAAQESGEYPVTVAATHDESERS
jgi:HAMP domain-containing protein